MERHVASWNKLERDCDFDNGISVMINASRYDNLDSSNVFKYNYLELLNMDVDMYKELTIDMHKMIVSEYMKNSIYENIDFLIDHFDYDKRTVTKLKLLNRNYVIDKILN